MVTILKSATFEGLALIRGEVLIRGKRLFQFGYPKVRRLFEVRRLLEEIRYEYKVILEDFNINPVKLQMKTFLKTENLTYLIKKNTCFKGVGPCIDLILTHSKYYFYYYLSIDTGLSDHHHWYFQ